MIVSDPTIRAEVLQAAGKDQVIIATVAMKLEESLISFSSEYVRGTESGL